MPLSKNHLELSSTPKALLVVVLLVCWAMHMSGQSRNYQLVYSDNIRGGATMFGNTFMQIVNDGAVNLTKMNGNKYNGSSVYGNDNENMQYVDIDNETPYGNTTRNSSESELRLPAGDSQIKFARIYWGGSIRNSEFDLDADTNQVIKIRKNAVGNYATIRANNFDRISPAIGYTEYQAYADITNFIQQNGVGSYQVANAPLSTGAISGGFHGGWCIVVVFENQESVYNSVRVYDGFEQIYNNSNPLVRQVTLNGLNVPSGALAAGDARMGILAWEGDANLRKDYLKINGHLFSNAMNQPDNPWNGTITDDGISVTSRNPNYTNQMGVDIDMFNVGKGYDIQPNATSVDLEFGTEADQYYPGVFMFAIKMKDPQVQLDNHVTDNNNNHLAQIGETLTYTLVAANKGQGSANDLFVIDTLPTSVSFIPGSLGSVDSLGNTTTFSDEIDDDAAEFYVSGNYKIVRFHFPILAPAESVSLNFQVKVNDPGPLRSVPSVINIARMYALSDAGDPFVDDAFSFMSSLAPEAGALPVMLVDFTATKKDADVLLNWNTAMEFNCKQFILQRSDDGLNFTNIGFVEGHGTSSVQHNYNYLDKKPFPVNGITYYRLEQVDFDGAKSYSKVVSLHRDLAIQQIAIYPNPAATQTNIVITSENGKQQVDVVLYDLAGTKLLVKSVQLSSGKNMVPFPEIKHLSSGTYIVKIKGQMLNYSGKLVKN